MKQPSLLRRQLLAAACAAIVGGPALAQQAPADRIRIGFMTDIGSVFASVDGPGGVDAVRMAIEDFGPVLGKPVEVLVFDHQNKADLAALKAREWFDREGVQALFFGSNSAAALASTKLAAEKKRMLFAIGAGSPRLTNEDCTPYTVQYAYNTDSLVNTGVAAALRQGMDSWYILAADYAFGHAIEAQVRKQVAAGNGKVAGAVRHPINTSDFSSFMVQAQATRPKVLALANAGGDSVNAIKAAREFGLTRNITLLGFGMTHDVIHSLGLPVTQGLRVIDHWDWTVSEQARRWGQRFIQRNKVAPTSVQAADYSAVTTYLNAVKSAGTTDADAVAAALRKLRINDMYTQGGYIREDGQMIHPIYMFEVKTPAEQKEPFDYYKTVGTIAGDVAFAPLKDSTCPLVRK